MRFLSRIRNSLWFAIPVTAGFVVAAVYIGYRLNGKPSETIQRQMDAYASVKKLIHHTEWLKSPETNYRDSIKFFTKQIEMPGQPKNAVVEIYVGRGAAYAVLGERKLARRDFDTALAIKGASSEARGAAFLDRGILRLDENDQAGALADFTTALKTAPNEVFGYGHICRAAALSRGGDYKAAIAEITGAIDAVPKWQASSLAKYDRPAQDVPKAFNKLAHKALLESFLRAKGDMYLDRGMIYAKSGNYEKAYADYAIAAPLLPRNRVLLERQAVAAARTGRWGEAFGDWYASLAQLKFRDMFRHRTGMDCEP